MFCQDFALSFQDCTLTRSKQSHQWKYEFRITRYMIYHAMICINGTKVQRHILGLWPEPDTVSQVVPEDGRWIGECEIILCLSQCLDLAMRRCANASSINSDEIPEVSRCVCGGFLGAFLPMVSHGHAIHGSRMVWFAGLLLTLPMLEFCTWQMRS